MRLVETILSIDPTIMNDRAVIPNWRGLPASRWSASIISHASLNKGAFSSPPCRRAVIAITIASRGIGP
jgi:hypothetical protein